MSARQCFLPQQVVDTAFLLLRNHGFASLTSRAIAASFEAFTPNPYLNQAIGYVSFARTERNLFRFLFVDSPTPFETPDPPVPPGSRRSLFPV